MRNRLLGDHAGGEDWFVNQMTRWDYLFDLFLATKVSPKRDSGFIARSVTSANGVRASASKYNFNCSHLCSEPNIFFLPDFKSELWTCWCVRVTIRSKLWQVFIWELFGNAPWLPTFNLIKKKNRVATNICILPRIYLIRLLKLLHTFVQHYCFVIFIISDC